MTEEKITITEEKEEVVEVNPYDESLVRLLVVSVIAGLVIVVYVLIIVRVESTQKRADPVELASKEAAAELTKIVVSHPRFGLLGLANTTLEEDVSYAMEPPAVRSFNSMNKSIKTASAVAAELDSGLITELIDSDLDILETLSNELIEKIDSSVAKSDFKDEDSIYKQVFQSLKSKLPYNVEIAELSITTGGYGKSSGRATFVNAIKGELNEPYVEHGFYIENTLVPVTEKHHIRFYKNYTEAKSVPPKNFVLNSPGIFPSAVLVEVKLKDRSKPEEKLVAKSACSLIGVEPPEIPPTCLVLRFPHGALGNLKTLRRMLESKTWFKKGNWGQSVNGNVPGKGHLNPTIDPVLEKMKPDDAILTSIYNWIKTMDPSPAPERFTEMFQTDFLEAVEKTPGFLEKNKIVNSCLAVDTGARERAFLKATRSGNKGQRALARVFDFPGDNLVFPGSALPVIIDLKGRATNAGRSDFNEQLVQNYLDHIYTTNLSAIETMAAARLISKRYQAKLMVSKKGADMNKKVIALSRIAGKNGLKVASKSFEISSQNLTLTRGGLHYINKPAPAYLLGRKLVFKPFIRPISEEDILTYIELSAVGQVEKPRWLNENLNILASLESTYDNPFRVEVEGKPLDLVLAEKVSNRLTRPLTVIFESRDLQSEGAVIPHISTTYPFASQPVREDQSVYYSKNAIRTGINKEVFWSLVVRDNSFHKNTNLKGSKYIYRNRIWCKEFEPPFTTSPRLSLEIQLRRPLLQLGNIPRSTLVTDPRFDRKVPIVPPIPPEMM